MNVIFIIIDMQSSGTGVGLTATTWTTECQIK